MKINALILALALLLPLWAQGIMNAPPVVHSTGNEQAAEEYEQAPACSFMDRTGKKHALADFSGKIVVLNFWASWCAPCIEEFPRLLTLAAENKNDIVLIALSSDTDETAMQKFLKQHKIKGGKNVYIAYDADRSVTQDLFQTVRLPETILIDRAGKMRAKMAGAAWSDADMNAVIAQMK